MKTKVQDLISVTFLSCAYCTMYDCSKTARYKLGQVSDEQILPPH